MPDYLFKTEPDDFSFDDLKAKSPSMWDGVRNPVALKNMREIAKGDRVFIYHTGSQKAVVGVAHATSTAYPDPKAASDSLYVIDLAANTALDVPVTLAQLKTEPLFESSPLVRQGRLSVVPLTAAQARRIEALGSGK